MYMLAALRVMLLCTARSVYSKQFTPVQVGHTQSGCTNDNISFEAHNTRVSRLTLPMRLRTLPATSCIGHILCPMSSLVLTMATRKKCKYFHSTDLKDSKAKTKENVLVKTENTLCNGQISLRLTEYFFTQHSTVDLARNLLGKYLCRHVNDHTLKGIIVETEAYLGAEDHASYSFGGRRTEANEPMYMSAGTCFTRFTYGMYYCLNISSNDHGGAVLIRAIEPVEGIEGMCKLRREHPKAPNKERFAEKPFHLANGPSKLCIAFGIDRALNKADLIADSRIWLEDNNDCFNGEDIVASSRIGISASNPWADKPLRYYLKNFKSVSKK